MELREHIYHNEDGSIFARKVKDGYKHFEWSLWDGAKYIPTLCGKKAPLYRADEVRQNSLVILVEGEKDADTIHDLGLCGTTGANGASWDDRWAPAFTDKEVLICGDRDKPGQEYVLKAGQAIAPVARSVSILTLPKSPPVKDISDLLEAVGEAKFADLWEEMRTQATLFADLHWQGKNGDEEPKEKSGLPPLIDAWDLCESDIIEPPVIIEGILHQGCKMVLGGGSKSFKTWMLLELAIALAHGDQWLGHNVLQGNVAYLNFELPEFAMRARIEAICRAKGLPVPKGRLKLWNLRGHAAYAGKILPILGKQLADMNFCAAFVDPLYKLRPGVEDNSAGHMTDVMNSLDHFTKQIGASMIYGEHFAKGPAGLKDPIDRISGSGVQTRDPDTIVLATKHKVPGCFSIEMILRCFAPVESFVVRRDHPLMTIVPELDPEEIKMPGKAGENAGRPSGAETRSTKIELELLKSQGMTMAELQKATGIKETTLKRDLATMTKEGRIFHSQVDHKYACR